jgi:hypothetical protein
VPAPPINAEPLKSTDNDLRVIIIGIALLKRKKEAEL